MIVFNYKEGQIYETRLGGNYGKRKVASVLEDGKCFTYSICPDGEPVMHTTDLHYPDGTCEGYKGGDLISLISNGENMKNETANNPAFPCYDPKAPASDISWPCGMTKREHFALEFAKALAINTGRNGYQIKEGDNLFKDAILAADLLLDALA